MVFLPTDAFKTIIAYAGHNYQQKHKLMMQGVMEVLDSLPKDWLADAIECGWFYEEEDYGGNIDQLWDEYVKPKNWEFHSSIEEHMEILSQLGDDEAFPQHQMCLLDLSPFFHKDILFVPPYWIESPDQHRFGSVRKYCAHRDILGNYQWLKHRINEITAEVARGVFSNTHKLHEYQERLDNINLSLLFIP
jgi:hypothetical protein